MRPWRGRAPDHARYETPGRAPRPAGPSEPRNEPAAAGGGVCAGAVRGRPGTTRRRSATESRTELATATRPHRARPQSPRPTGATLRRRRRRAGVHSRPRAAASAARSDPVRGQPTPGSRRPSGAQPSSGRPAGPGRTPFGPEPTTIAVVTRPPGSDRVGPVPGATGGRRASDERPAPGRAHRSRRLEHGVAGVRTASWSAEPSPLPTRCGRRALDGSGRGRGGQPTHASRVLRSSCAPRGVERSGRATTGEPGSCDPAPPVSATGRPAPPDRPGRPARPPCGPRRAPGSPRRPRSRADARASRGR